MPNQIFRADIAHHKNTAAEIPCSSQSLACVGAAPGQSGRRPYTSIVLCVPMYTFPFTTVGTLNFTALPA
jgi:hypothetical protein